MTGRLLTSFVLALFCAISAFADTLIVAGHTQQLPASLITVGDEILAPVTPSLRLIGITVVRDGSDITVTATGKTPIALSLDSTTASVGTRKIILRASPRDIDGTLYLPIRGLAPWLGIEARYSTEMDTLALHPLLSVTYEGVEEGVAIRVRSVAAIQYTSGQVTNPPRFFFDFKNAALGLAEQ